MNLFLRGSLIFMVLSMTTTISLAGKCPAIKVNDCSTYSDSLNDRSDRCKNSYKAGAVYGGYSCKWQKVGTGGHCYPSSSCS